LSHNDPVAGVVAGSVAGGGGWSVAGGGGGGGGWSFEGGGGGGGWSSEQAVKLVKKIPRMRRSPGRDNQENWRCSWFIVIGWF